MYITHIHGICIQKITVSLTHIRTCIQKRAHHTHGKCKQKCAHHGNTQKSIAVTHTWEHTYRSVHITHRNMHTKDYSVSNTWEHAYRSVHVTHRNMHTEVCNWHTHGNMQTSVQPSHTGTCIQKCALHTYRNTHTEVYTLHTENMHTEVCISHQMQTNKPQTCLWSSRQGAASQGGFY